MTCPPWWRSGNGAHGSRAALEAAGALVLRLPGGNGRVLLRPLMLELARRELSTVLAEGEARNCAAALLEEDLVDRVIFFIAPKLLGGRTRPARSAARGARP